jgi:small subunit ribosomal protein S3
MVSGRIEGVEIARSEWFKEGRMPLHTFRADIDYGFSEAIIKKGKIGIKVWIFKKELYRKTDKDLLKEKEAELIEKEKIEQFEEKETDQLEKEIIKDSEDKLEENVNT